MNLTLYPSVLGGTVRIPSSKSEAHRLLICAALSALYSHNSSPQKIFIECTDTNEDIDATIRCLIGLGAQIEHKDGGFWVSPITRQAIASIPVDTVIDCGESGSTLRFLLPIIPALNIRIGIMMHGRLPSRPLSPLYEELLAHGAEISKIGSNPLWVGGKLNGSAEYSIRGDVSSQFISGLLFALPLLEGESVLKITGKIESAPYIHMTLDAMRRFTSKINGDLPEFIIQQDPDIPYLHNNSLCVGGDWSGAAFWLTAGIIGNSPITLTGLDRNTRQGDADIISILETMGGRFICQQDSITAYPSKLIGCGIDASNTPDLVPILAIAASVAQGQAVISGASRLRIKESDRLMTVCKMLSELGANVKETEDGLMINGVDKLVGGTVSSFGDHRIAMSAGIAAANSTHPVTLIGAESVSKSYPAFWDDYKQLGGLIEHE